MRTALLASAFVITILGGCTSAPEDTSALRESICSSGGGGDECVAIDGYCPASCSNCFGSMSEKVHVLNLWECQPIGGGSGGGGGGTCGSTWQQIFGASATDEQQAMDNLKTKASTSCVSRRGCSNRGQDLDEVFCHAPMGEWYCEGRLRCDYR